MTATTLETFQKEFLSGEDIRNSIVEYKCSTDIEEGYHLLLNEDWTIAFGHGDLAKELSQSLFHAIKNEISRTSDIIPDHYQFEYLHLDSLQSWATKQFLYSNETYKRLEHILAYIRTWRDMI